MSYENDYISVYDYNNENENENESIYQNSSEDRNINQNIYDVIKPSKKIYKKNKLNFSIIIFLMVLIVLLYFLIKKSYQNTTYYVPTNIEQIINSEPIFNLRH
jgi:uncharacterized membrane protein YvbJ